MSGFKSHILSLNSSLLPMKTSIQKSSGRGHANHGWLDAHHSFSFASWYDPDKVHFGMLRVLNDDVVAPGMGFGKHPHDNMEIVTIPLQGSLKHVDSMGNEGVIEKGEVQIMSAGTGIYHSEMNASATESTNILQTWVFPKEKNIQPRYDQRKFEKENWLNKLCLVVSPDKKDEVLWINQDCWYSLGAFDKEMNVEYKMHKEGTGIYIFVIEGKTGVGEMNLDKRDAIGIWETDKFSMKVTAGTELLMIEVPMK
jgi:redox-sensitive bicupin YhaK (pirin superfamily)